MILPRSRWPGGEVVDHLLFAMKNEAVDLRVLHAAFERIEPGLIAGALCERPGSKFARRLCFLYEWLTGERLRGVPSVNGNAVDALDPSLQYGADRPGVGSRRFRVRDNLPGTRDFCPLVSRTRRLDSFLARDLGAEARRVIERVPPELVGRASAYLLLKDSKASFAIEDETPGSDRAQGWAATIGKAGAQPLDAARLLELQKRVLGDTRFTELGFRREGGFIGHYDAFKRPVPDHVSARHDDLPSLIEGMVAYDRLTTERAYPPVLAAAGLAFGFVYAHPFEDGNGRVHRYLIHHVLAERRFSPPGVIFPVSAAMADDILSYHQTLEAVTRPMLPFVDWTATPDGNVAVENETAPLYRYFGATRNAEYLFGRIERTIERDLPEELSFLETRDRFHYEGTRVVDMPERRLDALLHILRQNEGRLSARKRGGAFAALTDEEAARFEALYERVRPR